MIAPMKKFVLVILDKERFKAPLQLRKLGVAHVERFQASGEGCAALEAELKKAAAAKSILISGKDKNTKPLPPGTENIRLRIDQVLSKHSEIQALKDRLAVLRKEAERIASWGDFDPGLFKSFDASGLRLRLAECGAGALPEFDERIEYISLPAPKKKLRRVIIGQTALPEGWEELRLPEKSLMGLRSEIRSGEEEVKGLQRELASKTAEVPEIDKEIRRLEAALAIERLSSGMPSQESLCYFSGFVPASEADLLKAEASAKGWALLLDEPSEEELPPTKIENPPAIRIIQPVFDFLGTVPGYREYDISPSFLIFFSLFFAMIFGDGGYGFLMFAGAVLAALSARRKGRRIPEFTRLLFVLSGSTMLWGLLTGSWFALPIASLPGFLRLGIIRAFAADNPESGTNIKIFCFVIGALQLSIAHLKNIKRDFPNPKFIAQFGSLALVIGMFNAVLNLVVDASRFPLTGLALGLIGGGFLAVLSFGAWNGKFLSSLLEGLKGIIPTFLGTVSVFADIVSYIRLWAVSLAGVAISQTVNGMVANLVGGPAGRIVAFAVGLVAALGLVLAGHGLNFLMTVLSVLVHGVRLNMLEFSSHLGMEWSGYAYDPLREIPGETDTQE
jgi:V/A-type H+-transporting ATPase subunit I